MRLVAIKTQSATTGAVAVIVVDLSAMCSHDSPPAFCLNCSVIRCELCASDRVVVFSVFYPTNGAIQ